MYYENEYLKMYYEVYGKSKKTIVILPGWGDTRNTFNYLINNLVSDYKIIIMDYPSFGKSILKKDMTIYNYTESIKELLDKEKIKNPIIIAHSFGGRITSLLTTIYNYKVEKIILIDVAGLPNKRNIKKIIKQKTYKTLKIIIEKFFKKNKEYYLNKLLNKFASTDYKTLPSNMRKTFKNVINEDLTNYYKKINFETLIIWGEKDDDTKLSSGKKLNRLIKDSALITLKGAKHYSYLNYPLLTLKIIIEFIK